MVTLAAIRAVVLSDNASLVWADLASIFALFGTYELIIVAKYGVEGASKAFQTFVTLLAIGLFVFHACILHTILRLSMRDCRLMRAAHPPVIVDAICSVVMMAPPLVFSEWGILVASRVDFHSLLASILLTLDFFCIHIVLRPAYDCMVVHTMLGITASVACFLLEGDPWRPFWVTIMIVGFVLLLSIHGWLSRAHHHED